MEELIYQGRVRKMGDECDTGQILPGRYVPLTDPAELATHLFEDVAPDLRGRISPGDILVGGRNFGCGSSREHAPKAIKFSGLGAVVADSFARIFFRNALNLGLPAVAVPGICAAVREGERLRIDIAKGELRNLDSGAVFAFPRYEDFIVDMLRQGGIIPYTVSQLTNER